jgi:LysM repeat protein
MTAGDRGPVCPYLGLADDPVTYLMFPSSAQWCHAKAGRPTSIEHTKQAQACLVEEHVRCGRYSPPQVVAAGSRTPFAIAMETAAGATAERVPPATTTMRRGAGQSRDGGRRTVRAIVLALALVVVAVVGIVLGTRLAGSLGGTSPAPAAVGATESPSGPVATATPQPTPTPAPTPSPSPSPAPTLAPTPSPSPTASVTPSPSPLVHVVKSGETLSAIALRYGVTVAAIQAANGIKDPNKIVVGQKLVIPKA